MNQSFEGTNLEWVGVGNADGSDEAEAAASSNTPAPTPGRLPTNYERPQRDSVQDAIFGGLGAVDSLLGTDLKTRAEQNAEATDKLNAESEAALEEAAYDGLGNTIGTETLRATTGAIGNSIDFFGEAAEYVGDVAGGVGDALGIVDREDKDIPWSDSYEAAQWDLLQLKGPKTAVGQAAESILTTVINIKQLGKLGVGAIGKGKTAGSRLATEAFRGALVDYFQNPGTGNLSNLVQSGPLANALSGALAQDEEDNDIIRRLKNMLEGGTIGIAVDGLTELYVALRAGRAARAAGKTPKQAAQKVVDTLNENPAPRSAGAEARRAENSANSALPDGSRPGLYEPHERAVQSFKADINDSAVSFGNPNRVPGSGVSAVDEVDFQSLKTVEQLQEFIKGKLPDVDVDLIAKRLRKQPQEYVQDTFKTLARFADSGRVGDLEDLRFTNTFNVKGVDTGGAVVLRALVDSATDRISTLAQNVLEVKAIDGDFATQATQILDRAETLISMKKQATQFSSTNLKNWGENAPDVKAQILKDEQQIKQVFSKWRAAFEPGADVLDNREAREEFASFAAGLVSTKGDPTATGDFFSALARVGYEDITKVYINSLLSGVLTTVRNVVGTGWAVAERPLTMAMGYAVQGKWKQARLALSAYDAVLTTAWDSLAVARRSFDAGESITTSGSKFAVSDTTQRVRQEIDNLMKTAATPGQRWAAGQLKSFHDLTESPWFVWPNKALQSQDDFFKSMAARMDLRMQAAVEADRAWEAAGAAANGRTALRNKAYEALIDKKIGTNGELLDSQLVNIAEDVSFQRELQGTMKRVDDAIKGVPGGRLAIPFVKTPHNLNVYAMQHMPGLTRFTDEWKQTMAFGSPDEQAVLRGRAALGYVYTSSILGLTTAGLMTGNGPPPGTDERRLWLRTHEPMSIKVGDKWVSYKGIPGFEVIASVLSDAVEIVKKLPEREAQETLAAGGFAIANAVTNRSYFQGLIDASRVLDTRNWSTKGLTGLVGDFGNTLAGGSGLRRNFENLITQGMYEYKDALNAAVGRLSGGVLGEKVPVIDILTGKPMPSKYDNPFNAINPFTVVGKDTSPLVKTLAEIDFPVGDALVSKVNGVQLTPEEQNFLATAMFADGKLPGALKDIFKSRKFWKSYQEWREGRVSGDSTPKEDYWWHRSLTTTFSSYRRNARSELLTSDDPIAVGFREREAAEKARQDAAKVTEEVNELANFWRGS